MEPPFQVESANEENNLVLEESVIKYDNDLGKLRTKTDTFKKRNFSKCRNAPSRNA